MKIADKHLRELLLPVLAALIFVVCVTCGIGYKIHSEREQERFLSDAMARNDLRARQLASSVAQQTVTLVRLFDMALLQLQEAYLSDNSDLVKMADVIQKSLPSGAVDIVFVTDRHGNLLYSSDRASQGRNMADRNDFRFFAEGGEDRLLIGAPFKGRLGAMNWVIPLSRAIRKDGQFAGVVVIGLLPQYLSESLASLSLSSGDIVALIDSSGNFLARNHNLAEALGRKVPSDRPFLDPAVSDINTFRATSSVDGIPVDFAWKRLAEWPLISVVALDERAELAPIQTANAAAALSSSIVLVTAVVLSLSLSGMLLWAQRQQVNLRNSEQRYRVLFSRSKAAMLLIDPDTGAVVDANAAASEYYGYDIERLKGALVSDINILSPEEIDDELAAAREERRSHFNFRHRLANGDIRDVEVHSGPLEIDGRTLLFSIIHDITDRRVAERTIHDLSRRLQDVLAAASEVSIIATDRDGLITLFNVGAERMLGYGADDVVGLKTPTALHCPEEMRARAAELAEELGHPVGQFEAFVANAVTDGHEVREWTYLRKDGTRLTVSLAVTPVRSDDGEVTGYLGIATDISDRKEVERLLAREAVRYRYLLKTAGDGIHIVNRDGVLVEANESFLRTLGYDDTVIGKLRVQDWDTQDPWEVIRARNDDLMDRQDTVVFETRHLSREGGIVDVEVNTTGVEIDGEKFIYAASRDITRRKLNEAQLRDSEERFRSLVEGTTDWVWETDENHGFSWISPSFDQIIGAPSDTIIGKRRWDVASHDEEINALFWQAHIETLTAHRTFRDFRYWIRSGDGKARWITISGSPRFDNAGAFRGYRGSGTDITKQAALSTRLRLLSTAIEQSPVSVVITDPDGSIEYVNSYFTTVTGYEPVEVLGENPRIFASGDTPPEVYRDMWEIISSGHRWIGELSNKRKNGQIQWESSTIAPVLGDDGQVAHYVAIKEDITERRALRESLRRTDAESRAIGEHLRLVLETTGEGIVSLDDQFNVVTANRAAGEILGWPSVGAMVGRPGHDALGHMLVDGSACESGECAIRLAVSHGGIKRVSDEFFTNAASGEKIPVEFVVAPQQEIPGMGGAVVAFHDISERLTLRDQLIRTNAELEQFAYVASHDMRQPLRMVTSYLSLIEKRLPPETLTKDIKDYLDFAVGGAKRMDGLILGLLEYARTGKTKVSVPVPLGEAIDDAKINLTVAIREADAEIVVADDLPTISGDPTELTRLFQNLIGNAVKYHAPDRSPVIGIGCRRKGREWLVSIKDNGIGIAPADRERAFAIFQRLVAKDAYEGSGIGLAVCKKIVEHHGGRIWIESEVGVGSTFIVALPAGDATTAAAVGGVG